MIGLFAGKGILVLEGGEHRLHRKMLNAAFTPSNIRRLRGVFRDKAREVEEMLGGIIDKNGDNIGVLDTIETFSSA